MDVLNSAFGSSCSWMTCMDECLTEYFLNTRTLIFTNIRIKKNLSKDLWNFF